MNKKWFYKRLLKSSNPDPIPKICPHSQTSEVGQTEDFSAKSCIGWIVKNVDIKFEAGKKKPQNNETKEYSIKTTTIKILV